MKLPDGANGDAQDDDEKRYAHKTTGKGDENATNGKDRRPRPHDQDSCALIESRFDQPMMNVVAVRTIDGFVLSYSTDNA